MNANKQTRTQNKNPQKAGKKKQKPSNPRPRNVSVTTSAPVSFGNTTTSRRPAIKQSMNGTDITIKHREFVGTFTKSTMPFQVDALGTVLNGTPAGLIVNPSNAIMFPWLSAIAGRYESYLFEEMLLEFKTESSSSSTGYVLIATDYNVDDDPPLSKQQALQYESVLSGPYWQNMNVRLQRKDLQKRKSYFCNNGKPLAGPQNLYDTARIFVCVGGAADNSVAGDLYVSYTVKLMTPELGSLPGQGILQSSSRDQTADEPFSTVSLVSDTAAIGRPLSNELTQGSGVNNPRFTATKDLKYLIEINGLGTGIGSPSTMSSILENISGRSAAGNISNLFKADATQFSSTGVINLVKGDRLNFQNFLVPFTTMVSTAIRISPWALDNV